MIDAELSEDSADLNDVLLLRRPNSSGKYLSKKNLRLQIESRDDPLVLNPLEIKKEMKERRRHDSFSFKERFKVTLLKRQKKFKSKYDKRKDPLHTLFKPEEKQTKLKVET